MAFRRYVQHVHQQNHASMETTVKIVINDRGWQQKVSMALRGVHGISSFTMEDSGMVVISGAINLSLVLNRLRGAGLRASILQCSFEQISNISFLISDSDPQSYSGSSYYPQNNCYPSQGHVSNYSRHEGRNYGYPRYIRNGCSYPRHGGYGSGYDYLGHGGNGYCKHY